MKWTLLMVLFVALAGNGAGQDIHKGTAAFSDSPVNIALDEVKEVYVAPPQRSILKSAKSSMSTFTVTFVNFPEEAKQAFNYAVSIWEELISSPIPIHIEARWEPLEGNILAKGSPAIFYNNFTGAPLRNVYYPVALAEKLSGREMNAGAPDVICRFSSRYNWYFGTDGNTPATHYDLVSSSLHEITHGLGFSGFLNQSGGKGYFNNNSELPSIYDYFLFNTQNQQISNKSLFKSHSDELFNQITSDKLKFCQTVSVDQEQKMIDWIYAPPVWNDGTSIYHLKGYEYGEENGLMSPFAVKGRAIHNPGTITMSILAELGWKTVDFEFNPLKDLEKSVAEWPVHVGITTDDVFKHVKVVYSYDEFSTASYSWLNQPDEGNGYTGNLRLNHQPGKIRYYIEATTFDNRTYRHPAGAPSNTFALNIGPDYFVPELFHNPVELVSGNVTEIGLIAGANDNMGIKNVTVDYKINGQLQEPILLANAQDEIFAGSIALPFQPGPDDRIEYRITAEDVSAGGNKSMFPSVGFQEVEVFIPYEPVSGYTNNFESGINDFSGRGFSVSPVNGLMGNSLHTASPYPVSAIENEKLNIIAQLKYPVIIRSGGLMRFDEVVLIEPGQQQGAGNDATLWDYVIVEASKDGGTSWLPLTKKYNSGSNDNWYSAFTKSFSGNTSKAIPHESLFVNQMVNLTHNTGLEEGDTAIFRFRLASDNSVNGFGWAIDNLEIQDSQASDEELFAEGSYLLYPNPAKNQLYIEWTRAEEYRYLDVTITDLMGKIVSRSAGIETAYNPRTEIDLTGINPGIYLVSIAQGNEVLATNKIIKN